MLFNKDPNKRYVDMCAEFDEEFYSGHRDDTKLFKYMYLMYYMFACKNEYFKRYEDVDEYAKYSASVIYTRYLKKEKKGERIKSLKNYTDSTHRHLKVMFQKERFNTIYGPNYGAEESIALESYMRGLAESAAKDDTTITDVEDLLYSIPRVVNKVINQTPYKKDKLIKHRLKISCLLTLVSGLTLSRDSIERIKNKEDSGKLEDKHIYKLLTRERENSVVLWRLDESMADYVRMLSNKVRFYMSNDLAEIKHDNMASDEVINDILKNVYKEVYGVETKEVY